MFQTLYLEVYRHPVQSSSQPYVGAIIIPILSMRKLRLREVKFLGQINVVISGGARVDFLSGPKPSLSAPP